MQRRNRWYQKDHKQLEEMGIIYQITLCDFSVLQLLEINHWLPILIQTYSFWRKRNPYAFSSTIYLSVPSNQQYWCICHSHALCMTKQLTFLSYLQLFFLYYHEWSSNWISNTNETHTISLSVTLNLTLFYFLNYGMHETEKNMRIIFANFKHLLVKLLFVTLFFVEKLFWIFDTSYCW